ncbi:glycosyltransferase family 4 protein [Aureimonas mangrovi]|uniref:glycosyltransferase family 4 protein n=1 Tax=Aureimonas mangrovi TaxID=2758041 RepID=UPI00163D9C18|nr:glycosyltransferase family 4 protein [Aureimonas mangrovi]
MRTALLAWDYPPAPSGLSVAAREIAESLAQAGCDVTVFTLDRHGEERVGGVRIVGCDIPAGTVLARLRLYGAVGHLAAPIAFRRAVLREHSRLPFAVVEATNWYAPASLLVGAGLTVVTRNSTPAAFTRGRAQTMRDRLDGWAADTLERRQARGSAALISNTADHAAKMAALYELAADVPHAVAGLSLAPEFVARARDASYPLAGPAQLLFVGRAEARKGFDALLDAIVLLAGECEAGALPSFDLRLLGVPPEDLPRDLPGEARSRIVALGRRPDDALQAEYEAAHIVVAPSRYESFGLVYQEALAYGRATVASAEDASARAFVGESGGGVLAAKTSAQAIAEVLRPLIHSHDARLCARKGALRAAGRFTRESLAEMTLALYRTAIARSQSR